MISRLLALWLLLLLPAAGLADELAGMLDTARRGGAYRTPPPVELAAAEALFERTLRGGDEALAKAWEELDMRLSEVRDGGERFWLLREGAGKTGRGVYLFRRAGALPLVWQAPHGFKDLDTDRLALALLREGRAVAATWNSVPRDGGRGGERDADLAHLPESYLTAFSRAFVRVHPDGAVIQLHGFAPEGRKDRGAREADLILSAGHRYPGYRLRQVAACLGGKLPGAVRLYPDQARELGGTTNRIGRLLRELGLAGFIHGELSPALRRRLLDSSELRGAFLDCLEDRKP